MSTNLAAARYVTRNAHDPAEARMFFDMLGLVDSNGRITPDSTERESRVPRDPSKVVGMGPLSGGQPVITPTHAWLLDRPKVSTAPDSLRNLRSVGSSVIPRGERRPPVVDDRCGEPSGYRRHHRRGEHSCRACRDAANRDRSKTQQPGQPRKQIKYPECGTVDGWKRHRSGKNRVCAECAAAVEVAA